MRDRQGTLAEEGFERYRKPTRREIFLEEMERIIPWAELAAVIEPFYPKGKGGGSAADRMAEVADMLFSNIYVRPTKHWVLSFAQDASVADRIHCQEIIVVYA